jgi:hypothetical protein
VVEPDAAPAIFAVEGHDAAGKSTLAELLADRTGARLVRPFSGALGDLIAWLWGREEFALADEVARASVRKEIMSHVDGRPLIFDRHWMTMFTVLPSKLHDHWRPLPPAALCWTDVDTTCERLRSRGEPVGDRRLHERYCTLYRQIAVDHRVPIVDTTRRTVGESLDELLRHFHAAGATR